MEFAAFWRKREEYDKQFWEYLKRYTELEEQKSQCEEERADWEAEKRRWEAKRDEWEAEKDLAIRREAVRLLEEDITRRGGDQMERDMNSEDEEPEEGK